MKKRRAFWHYRGLVIFHKTTPGYALPYTTMTDDGQLAAETLKDMKDLIRDQAKVSSPLRSSR